MQPAKSGSPSTCPPGLEAMRSTFPSNELLGYSHASLRDVPRLPWWSLDISTALFLPEGGPIIAQRFIGG